MSAWRAGARLMAFLSGPPNYGRGTVFRERVVEHPRHFDQPVVFDPTFPDAFLPQALPPFGTPPIPNGGLSGPPEVWFLGCHPLNRFAQTPVLQNRHLADLSCLPIYRDLGQVKMQRTLAVPIILADINQ